MAQNIVVRTTNQSNTETRLVRQVDKEMAELEPQINPLYTFTTKMGGKSKPANGPKIEWFEDELVARWDTANGAVDADTASTTITVTDGTKWKTGDLGLVPQANTVSTPPEQFRVVSVSGNVLTVVRNVGSAAVRAIANGGSLLILGNAHEEYGKPVAPKTTIPVAKCSYTQIFKEDLEFSRTQMSSDEYASGGSERKRQQAKKMKELKIQMNQQFMFGSASESLTGGPTGYPVRTTMGFNSVVTTNTYDAGGVLTRKGLEEFSRMSFRYNPGKKLLLLAAPLIVSAIHEWGNSFLQLKPMENVLGVDITRVRTGHGEWILTNDVTLEDGIAGKNGFSGYAFSINLDDISQRVLKGSTLTLTEDVIRDGRDGTCDEIKGELGLVIKQEKHHAKIFNTSDFEA